MSEDKSADTSIRLTNDQGATASVTVRGAILPLFYDTRLYWYDGAWHPYPKGDVITVAK